MIPPTPLPSTERTAQPTPAATDERAGVPLSPKSAIPARGSAERTPENSDSIARSLGDGVAGVRGESSPGRSGAGVFDLPLCGGLVHPEAKWRGTSEPVLRGAPVYRYRVTGYALPYGERRSMTLLVRSHAELARCIRELGIVEPIQIDCEGETALLPESGLAGWLERRKALAR